MNSAQPYDVALVDFGQVISEPIGSAAMQAMAGIAGRGVEEFTEAYWRLRHAYDVDLAPVDYWSDVAGRRLAAADVEALVRADNDGWSVLNAETVAVLTDARAAGMRLVLLSNASAAFVPAFRALPVAALFEMTVFSGEVGVAKPDPRIFALAVERAGAVAARTFFVDDKPANVEAARGAGLAASVFTDASALRSDLGLA